jgi:hypothetical protein
MLSAFPTHSESMPPHGLQPTDNCTPIAFALSSCASQALAPHRLLHLTGNCSTITFALRLRLRSSWKLYSSGNCNARAITMHGQLHSNCSVVPSSTWTFHIMLQWQSEHTDNRTGNCAATRSANCTPVAVSFHSLSA